MPTSPHLSRACLVALALGVLVQATPLVRTIASDDPSLTPCAEIEDFLTTAELGRRRGLPVGVTAPSRTTLTKGSLRHDAAIQTVDAATPNFQSLRRTDAALLDSWKFNVAGYELAKMLSLNMVPPYVERNVSGQPASLSWWVDDAMMERERNRRKIVPPQGLKWLGEMHAVRIFRQLIYDTDPNQTNLLITKDWRIWLIDFTRAFRESRQLADPRDLVKCDRTLLARLRQLSRDALDAKLGRWLIGSQIDALLARRDLIVAFFDREVAAKGDAAVLYDLPRSAEPCGTGLREGTH